MSLQFITASSGAGKSCQAYQYIIEESIRFPKRNYYVIVPEQFTMQTQKNLVSLHPDQSIMNIDVLSFARLAYRVFEEVGKDCPPLLEETGKSFVLQKVAQGQKKELGVLGSNMFKPGYIKEMKSMISELMQYRIEPSEIDRMLSKSQAKPLLHHKLKDIQVLYQGFTDYLQGRSITQEEVLEVLSQLTGESHNLQNSIIVLDGFTGFTPVQYHLIQKLLCVCEKIIVTVTLDNREDPWRRGEIYQLFHMSKDMIRQLSAMARETKILIEEEIKIANGENGRFVKGSAMEFLEQNLFRSRAGAFREEQEQINIWAAASPVEELEEVAGQIHQLIRAKEFRYKDIAVITGDLEGYGNVTEPIFKREGIPFFIDRNHPVLMNPFVEYLRSVMEMAVSDLSYESVFRYLRSGMSDLNTADIDMLENYVIALGIRGRKRWQEHWVRHYRGMDKKLLEPIDQIRKQFLAEVGLFIEEFKEKGKTVKERTVSLYQFVARSQIQEKLKKQEQYFQKQGEAALVKEYAQIYGIVMRLLEKAVEILGDEVMRPADYQQLLEAGFEESQVGIIPPTADQVLMGDMERTRLPDIRALFFVGVNEGIIPKSTNQGVLAEAERDFLKENDEQLSPGARENMYIQRFYLYLNMTKPADYLYLSYAKSTASGEGASPAYLIHTVRRIFPDLAVVEAAGKRARLNRLETESQGFAMLPEGIRSLARGDEDTGFLTLFQWFYHHPEYHDRTQALIDAAFYANSIDGIGRSVAQALYGKVLENSATRLEQFSACAFAHFLEYGLGLKERARYEFNAMDMGNAMHESLERFSQSLVREGLSFKELEEEDRERLIEASINEIVDDYGNTILHASARNEYMIARVKRMLKRTVWALQEQVKKGDFEPGGFEISFAMEDQLEAIRFSLSEEESMRLKGRIDRLDVCEEQDKIYVKVIDYKSGNTSLDLIELYHGLQLQLVVYMNAAMELEQKKHPDKEVIPAGVFYYNIKDPVIPGTGGEDEEHLQEAILKDLCMNGLASSDPEVLKKLDRTLGTQGQRSSSVVPVTLNKDGSLSRTSSAIEAEKFKLLSKYVNQKIKDIGNQILQGEVQAKPYEFGKKNGCTYCDYRSICGFDEHIRGYEYLRLKKLGTEELWQAMEEEVE